MCHCCYIYTQPHLSFSFEGVANNMAAVLEKAKRLMVTNLDVESVVFEVIDLYSYYS